MHALHDLLCAFSFPINGISASLIGVVLYFLLLPFVFKKCRPTNRVVWALLFAYVPVVLVLTLLPFPWTTALAESYRLHHAQTAVNLIPLSASLRLFHNSIPVFLRNVGGNFLLLLPLGFLLGVLNGRLGFLRMVLIGLLTSVCIESLQLLENYLSGSLLHVVDVDDLIFNMMGCATGYGLQALMKTIRRRKGLSRPKSGPAGIEN